MSKRYPKYYMVTFEISSELDYEDLKKRIVQNPKGVRFENLILLTKEDYYGEPEYIPPWQPTLIKHAETILKGDEPGGTEIVLISN